MANVIGINLLGNWLLAAEVRGSSSRPTVHAVHAARLPSELTPENAQSLGAWLKSELAGKGFSATDAVCTLGRNALSSKAVRVPSCPDHELPAIVAFAVEGELHAPIGESILDFQADRDVDGEREVFAAMAPKTVVDALSTMLHAAGLNLKHIGPRAYATHFVWRRETDASDDIALIVSAGTDALDLSLWTGDRLTLSRLVPLSASDDLVSRACLETRRTLAAYHSTHSQTARLRIAVCGFANPKAAEDIAAATSEKVECFSLSERWKLPALPVSAGGPEGLEFATGGELIAAVGAAWSLLDEAHWPIDFLHPKRTVVPRNQKRSMAILGGALAALIVLGGLFYLRQVFQARDDRIKFYANQLTALNQQLADMRPTLDRHRIIKDWAGGETDWLSELAQLSATFPDTSQAYLTSLELYAGQSGKAGSMKLEGKAAKQTIVTTAQRQWAGDASHYNVSPRGMDPSKESPAFPWRFGLDLVVATALATSAETTGLWTKVADTHVPDGKSRVALSLESKAAIPGAVVKEETNSLSKAERKEDKRERKRDEKESKQAGREEKGESTDPTVRLVEKLKGLSIDEREKEIAKAPKFLQARIRKMIKEQKP